MNENGGEIGAFMAGFVIGGLVGAATALILAPQSGEETRAQIAAKGDEWRQYGEEQLQDYRTYAESTVGDVQERARIVLDEGKSRVSRKQAQDEEPETETAEESDGGEDEGEQAS
ncbi:MAG TPA: YtxH domain-containing protein [candidate division Zixibacteria bacterium]|nr:YtxH domain-containing protein [candidate division Zixibacteria bacterium]